MPAADLLETALAVAAEIASYSLMANLPSDIAEKVRLGRRLAKEDHRRWQKILNGQGWYAVNWPEEYGGTGWSVVQKHIFDEECAAAGAPRLVAFGVNMVAPDIVKFGTQAQKDYYLPRILRSEDWWCQGYSEPGAGSDLASLKTRAERDGTHYVVNGQKTWTTLGQHANRIFCLVRTDPSAKKQEGISFLLIDMDTPGITVRPIITLDGEHEVNEVFFDNVRVPVDNLVGEQNKGWTCAKYLLTHERTGQAGIGQSKAALAHLKKIASAETVAGRALVDDPLFRARIAEVEMRLMAVADEEAGTHFHPEAIKCQAVPCERGWRLSGRKRVVIGGELAHTILVTARISDGEGVSLFLLDPSAEGVSRTGYPCIDGPRACDLGTGPLHDHPRGLCGGRSGIGGAQPQFGDDDFHLGQYSALLEIPRQASQQVARQPAIKTRSTNGDNRHGQPSKFQLGRPPVAGPAADRRGAHGARQCPPVCRKQAPAPGTGSLPQ